MSDRNVLGGELEPCGIDPVTGFFRDGCCRTGPEDLGRHTICAVVTAEFLEHQRSIGNDLSTPTTCRVTLAPSRPEAPRVTRPAVPSVRARGRACLPRSAQQVTHEVRLV